MTERQRVYRKVVATLKPLMKAAEQGPIQPRYALRYSRSPIFGMVDGLGAIGDKRR